MKGAIRLLLAVYLQRQVVQANKPLSFSSVAGSCLPLAYDSKQRGITKAADGVYLSISPYSLSRIAMISCFG